jgi:N-acetylglutamate synthase-like GNAT family acetyltransferase
VSELQTATDQDLPAIRELLENAGLPTGDLASAKPVFTVLREGGDVVAAGALQTFGSSALLRSVVVTDERRGSGLGSLVVRELERMARSAQIERLILLTQTAREFFAREGYWVIERSNAPQEMQGSEVFRALCPASAACMVKVLANSDQSLV